MVLVKREGRVAHGAALFIIFPVGVVEKDVVIHVPVVHYRHVGCILCLLADHFDVLQRRRGEDFAATATAGLHCTEKHTVTIFDDLADSCGIAVDQHGASRCHHYFSVKHVGSRCLIVRHFTWLLLRLDSGEGGFHSCSRVAVTTLALDFRLALRHLVGELGIGYFFSKVTLDVSFDVGRLGHGRVELVELRQDLWI